MRWLVALALVACGDDPAREPTCDATLRPVVFAHGLLAASDTWSRQAARFEANGVCADRVVAFDWNTLAPDGAEARLDALIDATLAATGATQVDLVGHSAGGGLGYRYLAEPARAAKVAHYAHLASAPQDAPAGAPTLAVRSVDDTVISDQRDIPGASNLVLTGQDHYEVATSAETFAAMWRHFHDVDPDTTDVPEDESPTLAGKVVSLGENVPGAGWSVAIWPVDAATGARIGAAPVATFTADADGRWGPFDATSDARYELAIAGPSGTVARPVHYYLEPIRRSDALVYLRSLPTPESLVGVVLDQIPFDDRHAVVIAFSASKAVISGRNTLNVNARSLSTEALASAAKSTIAFFLFDENIDQTSGEEAAAFAGVIPFFLTAVDAFLPSNETLTFTLDGRTVATPAWPSASAGAVVVVFD